MITIVGVGHIFNLSEQIAFIIRHIWPDAVLVELDEARFVAMTDPNVRTAEAPKMYRKAAEYQKRMASENNTTSGAELLTAVNAGNMIGAKVYFIDKHAGNVMERVWSEMSFSERMRYRTSNFKDRFSRKETVENSLNEFAADEETYIEDMRKKFPTLVRIVIDERNEHMARRINDVIKDHEELVVVIGDGHVEGVSRMLNSEDIRKIRLKELMTPERMNEIRAELWSHKGEMDES